MQSCTVVATTFHCIKPVLVLKQRPNIFCSPENLKFKCFNRYPDKNLVIPILTISTRGMWDFTKCINVSWRWVSQIISVYLFFLNVVAVEAYKYPSHAFGYACEDVKNYYTNVGNLEGKPLEKKLNSIIAKHQSLSYREVWNALKILDASDVDNPEASSGIVEIYSSKVVPKSLAGKPDGWNREHLWPRSYGLKSGPSLTDIHNIRPADVNVNSSRGNKYYGECNVNSAKCLKPANKEAALDTETDKDIWAPPKQHRGDIARALMYMSICYGFRQADGGPVLHLSDSPNNSAYTLPTDDHKFEINQGTKEFVVDAWPEDFRLITYSYFRNSRRKFEHYQPSSSLQIYQPKSEMGLLSTLLKWNEIDPPSREEKLRNDRVCKFYQHNRNPFVDHPEYATLIWKKNRLAHNGFHHHLKSHDIQSTKQGCEVKLIGCWSTCASKVQGNRIQALKDQPHGGML